MSEKPIILTVSGQIAHLILSNPPKNEMTGSFFQELASLSRRDLPALSVKGMIVYGKGRHFSSGADVRDLISLFRRKQPAAPAPFLVENINAFLSIETAPFPVVAAINGCCLGSGLELSLACDYRIATAHAVFSLPEASFDIMPGCGGTVRLAERVKKNKAVEIILSGDMFSAEAALSMGLIDAVVKKEEILKAAAKIIHTMGKRKP